MNGSHSTTVGTQINESSSSTLNTNEYVLHNIAKSSSYTSISLILNLLSIFIGQLNI